jgi:hypothetical protein
MKGFKWGQTKELIDSIPKEELERLAKTCNTYSAILCAIGLHGSTKGINLLKNRMLELNIDTSNIKIKKPDKKQDFLISNQELMAEWDWEQNNAIGLDPNILTFGSNKKAHWICQNNHSFEQRIYSRAKGGGCAICSGQKVLAGFNDLQTINPYLASDWHPTKNGDLTPSQISPNSTKDVWWKCQCCEYEWVRPVVLRHSQHVGCPRCNQHTQTSFAEQAILFFIRQYYSAKNRHKIHGKEADIYIEDLNIAIEHNGRRYHNGIDIRKKCVFDACGIRLITVLESDKNAVEGDVVYYQYSPAHKHLHFAIEQVLIKLNILISAPINIENYRAAILSEYNNTYKETSLGVCSPDIAEEWHPTKNNNVSPYSIHNGSEQKVWWICKTCRHEWFASVSSRTKSKSGCPECNSGKKKVLNIDTNEIYESLRAAAKTLNVARQSLSYACKDQSRTCCGYHWKFVA